MKVVGFITEYNPFHYGHKYHLEKSLQLTHATHSIAVMSSSFVQRGEPSIVDKWTKAKIAIENGVDLVIELPFVYSTQSAEFFALGGIKILDSLNIVDYIAFGSETGELDPLAHIVDVLLNEPDEFKTSLKINLDIGMSFPSARSLAITEYFRQKGSNIFDYESILKQSNNILGIEYLKALKKINSSIVPVPLTRQGSDYKEERLSKTFASATAIRKSMLESGIQSIKDLVPNITFELLQEFLLNHNNFNHLGNYYSIIKYLLLTSNKDYLKEILDMENGLENRIVEQSLNSLNIKEIVDNSSTKRYPKTRIQRILIHLLNNISGNTVQDIYSKEVPYIRFLGANQKGLELLNQIKEKSNVPILTKFSKHGEINNDLADQFINFEKKATDIYYLGLNMTNSKNIDYKTSPYIKK